MLYSVLRGGSSATQILTYILSTLAVVFLTLPVHEYAHGFIAVKLGDPTPRYQGRLTLNPFAHIDWMGAACIILFGFGWARPVQVNSRYFKNPKRDMAFTALAGPVANFIMAFVSLLICNLSKFIYIRTASIIPTYVYYIFYYIADINVYLAVFNLIPIPPLDGSRLLSAFLPDKYYYKIMQYERYIFLAVLALLWLGVLSGPLSFLSSYVMRGISYLASLPFMFL